MSSKELKVPLFVLMLGFVVFIQGCAKKEPITHTIYQDVYVPVPCIAKLPSKPKYDPNDLHSAVLLANYYKDINRLLKLCVKEVDSE